MSLTKNRGRLAGLLYVLASIPGFFALAYVPGKLIVHRNAIATTNNIAASETLFVSALPLILSAKRYLFSLLWLCTTSSRASTSGGPRSW